MDTIGEYVKKLDKFSKDLPMLIMNETMETVGADIRATIENRIVTTGNKGSGGRFTEYKKKKSGAPGSYAELRRLHGLQITFKDFFFSGEMWRNFNVLRDQCKLYPDGFLVRFGGVSKRAQDIIDGQSGYEKEDIIDLTDAETEALGKRIDQIVLRKFKEYGL
jgi:hypothetical protein